MVSGGVRVSALVLGLATAVCLTAAGEAAAGSQCGKAAWYDLGGRTASGEPADGDGFSAAHRTLPFGTRVKVENLSNGKAVVVRVNDRGPFVGGRVIDVSRAAAVKIGLIRAGVAKVRVTVVDGDPDMLKGNCGGGSPSIVVASAAGPVPTPHLRPSGQPAVMTDLLALRFVYAFAPEDVRARTAFDLVK